MESWTSSQLSFDLHFFYCTLMEPYIVIDKYIINKRWSINITLKDYIGFTLLSITFKALFAKSSGLSICRQSC